MAIPPLRERLDDIPRLTEYFLAQHSDLGKERWQEIVQEISKVSMAYDWPGNIRELESMVHRMVVIHGSPTADNHWSSQDHGKDGRSNELSWQRVKKQALKKLEDRYLQQIMRIADGNVSHASKLAGIDRRSLQRMLRKHAVFSLPS